MKFFMEEVENQGVIEQEVATPAEATIQQEEPTVETQKPVDDRPDFNWRKEMERKEERLLKELAKRDEMLERIMAQNSPQKPQEIDELDSLSDDEFLDKGKNKKLVRKEIDPLKREIEDLKKSLQVQQSVNSINQLRATHSDFDDVVNPETLALLQESEPELAEVLGNMKDTYKMGLQTYKFIKANNLNANVTPSRRAQEVEKKLEKNSKTVQTPQAYEKRPMAQAFAMTDALKKELQDEMLRYSRMSGGY